LRLNAGPDGVDHSGDLILLSDTMFGAWSGPTNFRKREKLRLKG